MAEIDAYDYELPPELIAQTPLPHRVDSRMLVVRRDTATWEHSHVRDIGQWLSAGDCLVVNDTKVLPARLVGVRAGTGGKWSGLFLRAEENDVWMVLGKTRGKLQPGDVIDLLDASGRRQFSLSLLAQLDGGAWAAQPSVRGNLEELLGRVGRVPLPPYIRKGEMQPSDRDRYQTVYAEQAGAVAAPTAGLHFSKNLLESLERQGVRIARTTLHVGIGTFRPVSAQRLEDHAMHAEWGCVDEATVEQIREVKAGGGRVVAVGTTVVRVLETASLSGSLEPWRGETNLFIRPGFRFHTVDALLTNFHLPKSTLLVLVRTFGGEMLMQRAYEEAIDNRYRFFSYGDAMLIC